MTPSSPQSEDRHSRFELKTLLETSRLLIESHDMDFVLNNLLLITMGKLLITKGMILIHEPEADRYVVSKSKGKDCPDEGRNITFPDPQQVRKQSIIQQEFDDIDLPEIFESENKCTLFNLQTSNHHLGFLCLGPKGNKKPLTEREMEFIESLSIISSVAIANSRMFSELRRINRMLDRKVYELNTLFDLSKDFNMMVDRDEIVRIFKFAMLGQMLIRKFFFILEQDQERSMVASSGIKGKPSQEEINHLFELEDDLVEVDETLKQQVPFLKNNEIKAVIGLHFQSDKIALVGIGARANGEGYSTSDYNFLQSLGNLALLSIQKTILLEERIEKERMEEELNIAKSIQRGLLPDPIPKIEGIDLAATNISSYQVGGDYFDIAQTADGNYLFAIGDVTGKGVPAALLMANLQAMLHVLLPIDITLAKATDQINDIIYQNTPPDKFITFFWGKYHKEDHTFRFVNAGHNPPILLREGTEEPDELEAGGLILGAMSTMTPYQEERVSLSSGDILLFYTDGVTEALNPAQTEEYEEKRLIECLKKNRGASASDIQDAIIADVNAFSDETQYDDITIIVIKVD